MTFTNEFTLSVYIPSKSVTMVYTCIVPPDKNERICVSYIGHTHRDKNCSYVSHTGFKYGYGAMESFASSTTFIIVVGICNTMPYEPTIYRISCLFVCGYKYKNIRAFQIQNNVCYNSYLHGIDLLFIYFFDTLYNCIGMRGHLLLYPTRPKDTMGNARYNENVL